MGLETVTGITDLVITNPVGATDPKSQGDDHIRNIKKALKHDFPNITGIVTPTHSDLNQLLGAATNGRILDIVGLTDPNADRIMFWDDSADAVAQLAVSSNLSISGTTLDLASSFTISGTATVGTLAATTITGAGSGITALSGTNIASGTVADARLSANIPLLNAANTWTAAGTHTFSAANNAARIAIGNTNASIALISFSTNSTLRGYVGADGGGGQISGGAAGDMDFIAQSGNLLFSGNGGTTAHLALSSSGLVTTPNASAQEVGYKGMPQNSQSVDYTAVLGDADKTLHQTGASKTFTIPANSSVAYPIGTVLNFTCDNATGVSIAITTDTLRLAGTSTTGTRTLAQYGTATAQKILSTTWLISGAGLS